MHIWPTEDLKVTVCPFDSIQNQFIIYYYYLWLFIIIIHDLLQFQVCQIHRKAMQNCSIFQHVCHNVPSLSSFIPFCSFPSLSSTSIYLPSKSMCLIKPSAALKYGQTCTQSMHANASHPFRALLNIDGAAWAHRFRGFVYVCVRQ